MRGAARCLEPRSPHGSVSYDLSSNGLTDGLRNVLRLATAHIPMYSRDASVRDLRPVSLPQNRPYFAENDLCDSDKKSEGLTPEWPTWEQAWVILCALHEATSAAEAEASSSRSPHESGGGEIRTPETGVTRLLVFKTSAFNRSATPPRVLLAQMLGDIRQTVDCDACLSRLVGIWPTRCGVRLFRLIAIPSAVVALMLATRRCSCASG